MTQSLEGKGGGGGQGRLDEEEAANDAEGENSGNNNTVCHQGDLPPTEHSRDTVVNKGLVEDSQRLKGLWTAKTLSRHDYGYVKKNCVFVLYYGDGWLRREMGG
jgi:hypothetical protein